MRTLLVSLHLGHDLPHYPELAILRIFYFSFLKIFTLPVLSQGHGVSAYCVFFGEHRLKAPDKQSLAVIETARPLDPCPTWSLPSSFSTA